MKTENIDYYNKIKKELIDNEINKKIKDYSKNKYEIQKYYTVGKILLQAGNKYGENIIKEYSKKLINEVNKKYSIRYLYDIRKLYIFLKVHPLGAQLTISHHRLLFPLKDINEINYYINQILKRNLSKRDLAKIIKENEYKRLPEPAKKELINNSEKLKITDNIKNPIIINKGAIKEIILEKTLKKIILEDISSFLKELGNGFAFIDSEYKIRIGDTFNYIDILLYNIKYKCYVVVELKITELKKEYIGQIQVYMNYINKNVRSIGDNKTIGIIICKENNNYIIKYCSDKNIISREYKLI